ncbi:MAG: NAD(P)/FAD-dependent oxidoreductase [Candidatus Promineifilaceae bacterium]
MSNTFDVTIIGGGIMGCSTALQLARRGLKVALLEKGTIGAGPSGKSSAIIRQHYSNELTARMALYSLGVFQDFANRVGGECGFTRTGFIALAPKSDSEGLRSNVAMQQAVGIRTELLSAEALHELAPAFVTSDLVLAAYEPDSGYADPYLTVTSYASAARDAGVKIFQETTVTGIDFTPGAQSSLGRVSGVKSTAGTFSSPIVINATGAWAAQVAALAGLEAPIDACRVQVAFFRRPPGQEAAHPVVADFINATYFRSETGQITLVGLIDPSEANAIVDPDSFKESVDDEFIMEAGGGLVNRYPAMEQSQLTGGYASLYAITPDWHPIMDEIPRGSGLYLCSGFSGHGFKLGPAVGLMMAELVTGEAQPAFNPALFRFGRFAENEPVRGQYEYSIVG